MKIRIHSQIAILITIILCTMAFLSQFSMRSLAGPSEDAGYGTPGMNGNADDSITETEVQISDFDWFLDNLSYNDFEKVYDYSMYPLAQVVTDKSKLEGTWDMVIYHHPDPTDFAPVPLFLGKEIGKLYIENIGDDKLKISMKITEAYPDRPGDINPINENNLVIDGFWNISDIINANIEGGGSLDIYNFFTLPDERIHATGNINLMDANRNIYWAYLGLNKCDERQLRGDAANDLSGNGQTPGGSNSGQGYKPGNDEIVELAKKHSRAPFADLDSIDPDGTLNIHCYEQTGGHLATWDWYYINPDTLKGTNLFGDEIDLNKVR